MFGLRAPETDELGELELGLTLLLVERRLGLATFPVELHLGLLAPHVHLHLHLLLLLGERGVTGVDGGEEGVVHPADLTGRERATHLRLGET